MACAPSVPQAFESLLLSYGISLRVDADSSETEVLSEVFRACEALLTVPEDKLAEEHAPWVWLLKHTLLTGSVRGSEEAIAGLVRDLSSWQTSREADRASVVNCIRAKVSLDGLTPPSSHEYEGLVCPLPRLCSICNLVAATAERDGSRPYNVARAFGMEYAHSLVVANRHPLTGSPSQQDYGAAGGFEFIVPRRVWPTSNAAKACTVQTRQAIADREERRFDVRYYESRLPTAAPTATQAGSSTSPDKVPEVGVSLPKVPTVVISEAPSEDSQSVNSRKGSTKRQLAPPSTLPIESARCILRSGRVYRGRDSSARRGVQWVNDGLTPMVTDSAGLLETNLPSSEGCQDDSSPYSPEDLEVCAYLRPPPARKRF
jgi:hypothetical protein